VHSFTARKCLNFHPETNLYLCVFDEYGNAVVLCFCSVACGVAEIFYGCWWSASVVK